MRDYTYQDMLKMQEDAANRVREMKKRAAIVVDNNDLTPSKPPLPDEVRHISYPVELPEKQQVKHENEKEKEKESHNGLIDLLKKDKDVFLVLALLMVLHDSEERDQIISLALLYLLL